jgi:hypothetical protein
MTGSETLQMVAERLRSHPVIAEHAITVLTEAEEHDLEAVIAQELAKGGLHAVVAAGAAVFEPGARAAIKGARDVLVTLAYQPGMTPPPVNVFGLSCELAAWLHGWPDTGLTLAVTEEAPVPDGADISGRQIILNISELLRAAR